MDSNQEHQQREEKVENIEEHSDEDLVVKESIVSVYRLPKN